MYAFGRQLYIYAPSARPFSEVLWKCAARAPGARDMCDCPAKLARTVYYYACAVCLLFSRRHRICVLINSNLSISRGAWGLRTSEVIGAHFNGQARRVSMLHLLALVRFHLVHIAVRCCLAASTENANHQYVVSVCHLAYAVFASAQKRRRRRSRLLSYPYGPE